MQVFTLLIFNHIPIRKKFLAKTINYLNMVDEKQLKYQITLLKNEQKKRESEMIPQRKLNLITTCTIVQYSQTEVTFKILD